MPCLLSSACHFTWKIHRKLGMVFLLKEKFLTYCFSTHIIIETFLFSGISVKMLRQIDPTPPLIPWLDFYFTHTHKHRHTHPSYFCFATPGSI